MIRQRAAKPHSQTSCSALFTLLLSALLFGTNTILVVSAYHFRSTLCSHTLEKRASFLSLQKEASIQASLIPTRSLCQQVRRGQSSSSSSPAEPAGEARVPAAPQPPCARLRGAASLPSPTCGGSSAAAFPQKMDAEQRATSLPAPCPPRARSSGYLRSSLAARRLWARQSPYLPGGPRGPAPGSQALF